MSSPSKSFRSIPFVVEAWQYTEPFFSMGADQFNAIAELPAWLDDAVLLTYGDHIRKENGRLWLYSGTHRSNVREGEWLVYIGDNEFGPIIQKWTNEAFFQSYEGPVDGAEELQFEDLGVEDESLGIEDENRTIIAEFDDGSSVEVDGWSGGAHEKGSFGELYLRFHSDGKPDVLATYTLSRARVDQLFTTSFGTPGGHAVGGA